VPIFFFFKANLIDKILYTNKKNNITKYFFKEKFIKCCSKLVFLAYPASVDIFVEFLD
jgi:hypothetical protein